MQIILMDKVTNLGNLGDVVRVKDGYARNYLIPQGIAKRATQQSIEAFAARRAELEKLAADKLVAAQARAGMLADQVIRVAQKAGVDGRLFGSVTTADIAEALKAVGHDVSKAEVRLPNGPLKTVGEFPVTLTLHSDVSVGVVVAVVPAA
jgi:large subunit ribosomal protein L9